jgi:hypothetical protein
MKPVPWCRLHQYAALLLLMRMELLGTRPDMGLYYVLFLLTMALIVWTLPKVIIAWKER